MTNKNTGVSFEIILQTIIYVSYITISHSKLNKAVMMDLIIGNRFINDTTEIVSFLSNTKTACTDII